MWKKPKMIALTLFTAALYVGSLFPLRGFTMFGGYADFGRVGVGIPVAFSFLFGPAAAWGAAIGNVLRDIAQNQVDPSSFFGFIGNFVLGYVPYKIWNTCTKEKPDLRSLKKAALYMGIALLACILCGLVIGGGCSGWVTRRLCRPL
jgi:energy-coupling factor transport system substrate-specific component